MDTTRPANQQRLFGARNSLCAIDDLPYGICGSWNVHTYPAPPVSPRKVTRGSTVRQPQSTRRLLRCGLPVEQAANQHTACTWPPALVEHQRSATVTRRVMDTPGDRRIRAAHAVSIGERPPPRWRFEGATMKGRIPRVGIGQRQGSVDVCSTPPAPYNTTVFPADHGRCDCARSGFRAQPGVGPKPAVQQAPAPPNFGRHYVMRTQNVQCWSCCGCRLSCRI